MDSTPVFGNPDGTLSALKTSTLGLCCGHLAQMLWKCLLNGKLPDTELHKNMKEPSAARSPWSVFDSFRHLASAEGGGEWSMKGASSSVGIRR